MLVLLEVLLLYGVYGLRRLAPACAGLRRRPANSRAKTTKNSRTDARASGSAVRSILLAPKACKFSCKNNKKPKKLSTAFPTVGFCYCYWYYICISHRFGHVLLLHFPLFVFFGYKRLLLLFSLLLLLLPQLLPLMFATYVLLLLTANTFATAFAPYCPCYALFLLPLSLLLLPLRLAAGPAMNTTTANGCNVRKTKNNANNKSRCHLIC